MPYFPQRSKSSGIRAQRVAIVVLVGSVLITAGFPIARLNFARWQTPQPDSILMLGGGLDREAFTAEFARSHPHLSIWVSSGVSETPQIFQKAGIAQSRLHLDCRATDTVTNFTTLVDDLARQHIHHVYLLTSSYHLPRSTAIATIVLGSRGIAFTPIPIYESDFFSKAKEESTLRTLRDVGRSMLWVLSGQTGASLKPAARMNPACARPDTG